MISNNTKIFKVNRDKAMNTALKLTQKRASGGGRLLSMS